MASSDKQSLDSGWRSRAASLDGVENKPPKQEPSKSTAAPSEANAPTDWYPITAEAAFASSERAESQDASDAVVRKRRFTWVEWTGAGLVLSLLISAWMLSRREPAEAKRQVLADTSSHDSLRSPRRPNRRPGDNQPPPQRSSTERATAIADLVLEDAGDGSFSLSLEGEPGNDPSPELESASKKAATSPRRPRKIKPPVYADAPPPEKILPVQRLAEPDKATLSVPDLIPLLPYKKTSLHFERIYESAYETHQSYLDAKAAKAAPETTQPLLVESLLQFRQCLGRPRSELTDEQRSQVQYALAGLYLDAGRPWEAAIFGRQLTQFSPPDDALTVAATAIAFTALQLSHQSQLGDPKRPGELIQLESLLDTSAQRKIKLPQAPARRFATAQLFDQDGFHVRAAQNFAKIPKSSELYPMAQLQVGLSFQSEAARRKVDGIDSQQEQIVSSAAKYLDLGISLLDEKEDKSAALAVAKLSLARIQIERQNPAAAIQLLDKKRGVLSTPTLRKQLPDALLNSAYESLLGAYARQGQLEGVDETLKQLSELGGQTHQKRVAALAAGFIKTLTADPDAAANLTKGQLTVLDSILDRVHSAGGGSFDTALWMSQGWADLAEASSDPDISGECLQRSEKLLRDLLSKSDISEGETLGLQLKLVDLAIATDRPRAALTALSEVLKKTPAAIDLQMRAAAILSAVADISPSVQAYQNAIAGLPGDSIWGWNKLSSSLVRLHLDATDKSRHFDRLMNASFQLDRCRIRQAELTESSAERNRLLSGAKRHITQMLQTLTASSDEWTAKFEELLGRSESS